MYMWVLVARGLALALPAAARLPVRSFFSRSGHAVGLLTVLAPVFPSVPKCRESTSFVAVSMLFYPIVDAVIVAAMTTMSARYGLCDAYVLFTFVSWL